MALRISPIITKTFIQLKSAGKKYKFTPKPKQLTEDIFEANCHQLDLNTKSAIFFGLKDSISLVQQLKNHVILCRLKEADKSIGPLFPKDFGMNLDNPNIYEKVNRHLWEKEHIKELFEQGSARMTMYSRHFGGERKTGAHTIGLVVDPKTKNLYILDSLSDKFDKVSLYQNFLKEIFSYKGNRKYKFNKIVISNKLQQRQNELSCNHWAIANIEAIRNALKSGKKIKNTKELNEILPDDINKILQEQYTYVIDNKHKISFNHKGIL